MGENDSEARFKRIERAIFGGMADDGVTWQDGLIQSLRGLTESVRDIRSDRKWVFALLGIIAAGQVAVATHAYGFWGILAKLFGE